MVIASPILVGSSKARPLKDQGSAAGQGKEETGQQMTSFRGGQWDERRASGIFRRGRRRGGVVMDRDRNEKGAGEEDQRDMTVPAEVTSSFTMIQSKRFGGF